MESSTKSASCHVSLANTLVLAMGLVTYLCYGGLCDSRAVHKIFYNKSIHIRNVVDNYDRP